MVVILPAFHIVKFFVYIFFHFSFCFLVSFCLFVGVGVARVKLFNGNRLSGNCLSGNR
jgi:hypothetical protein